MKSTHKALLALMVGSILSISAQAATTGQPYVGVKVGQFMLEDEELDDITAYGIVGGYNFTPNWGVEAEYVGSEKGDFVISPSKGDVSAITAEYSVKTYGVYGTYRYEFPTTSIFAKGKLGFAHAESKLSYLDESYTDDITRLAGGVGVGYNIADNFAVEADYSVIQGDGDTSLITLGANYKF